MSDVSKWVENQMRVMREQVESSEAVGAAAKRRHDEAISEAEKSRLGVARRLARKMSIAATVAKYRKPYQAS